MNNKFVKDSLLPDENIIATAKFHGIKMWFSIIIFSLIFFFAIYSLFCLVLSVIIYINEGYWVMEIIPFDNLLGYYVFARLGVDWGVIEPFITIIFAIGAILCAYKISKWLLSFDEFVITNKRVVAKVGVIRRIAFELQSEQVESIEIHQGIIGRILNYGTLMPCGVGASKVRIPFVVNPFEFRQHFYDLKTPQNN